MPSDRCDCSRRQVVRSLFTGSMLFPAVLQQLFADNGDSLGPRAPHFPGKAKRVIFMYMPGGVSHVDSFDYKPKLIAAAEAKEVYRNGRLYVRPHWEFKPRGQSGTMVSELFPHIAGSMDDVCLIRSMRGDHNDHFQATLGGHTGSVTAARIKTFETAYGMQMQMPEVLDLSKETDATLKLYGLERGSTKGFAWQCIVARRLAERGVRFIELIDVGASDNWDAHGDIRTHEPLARNVDQPIAGLLADLKSRGMLEDTLVVWTTEFGRTPHADSHDRRGHYNKAYSSWIAGGGVKPGIAWGQTDDYGYNVAENEVHVHAFH